MEFTLSPGPAFSEIMRRGVGLDAGGAEAAKSGGPEEGESKLGDGERPCDEERGFGMGRLVGDLTSVKGNAEDDARAEGDAEVEARTEKDAEVESMTEGDAENRAGSSSDVGADDRA